MKIINQKIKRIGILLVVFISLWGCTSNKESKQPSLTTPTPSINEDNNQKEEVVEETKELVVRFGDEGEAFILNLYDNDTAKSIANYVGQAEWRLPIYNFDNYDNWEVMQYYDIPDRYEIPSNSQHITSVKAGQVYYSQPNRIVLFYGDAEIDEEYTSIGYFEFTEEFKNAVENNPVLEGWGNKIVRISVSK